MTALFFHSNDLAHLFEACYTRRVLSKFSDITGGKEVLMPFKKTKQFFQYIYKVKATPIQKKPTILKAAQISA